MPSNVWPKNENKKFKHSQFLEGDRFESMLPFKIFSTLKDEAICFLITILQEFDGHLVFEQNLSAEDISLELFEYTDDGRVLQKMRSEFRTEKLPTYLTDYYADRVRIPRPFAVVFKKNLIYFPFATELLETLTDLILQGYNKIIRFQKMLFW